MVPRRGQKTRGLPLFQYRPLAINGPIETERETCRVNNVYCAGSRD